jgi:invasion protein IalB
MGNGTKRCLTASLLLILATVGGTRTGVAAKSPSSDPLWTRQCVKSPEGKQVCFLQQFVVAMPQKTALLKAVFSYLGPKGGPRLELTAPLGIILQPGLKLTIDDRAPLSLPLTICKAGGCQSVIDLDEAALDQFRAGKTATVRYVTEDGKALDLPLKLEGLAEALKTIAP